MQIHFLFVVKAQSDLLPISHIRQSMEKVGHSLYLYMYAGHESGIGIIVHKQFHVQFYTFISLDLHL